MPTDINRDNVQRFMADGTQLVEVLPPKEYRETHLPEAINLPLKELNAQIVKSLDPTRAVITYCTDFQ